MGTFKGMRTKNGAFVTYADIPLDLRLDLKVHSPMGFEWGYNGSGPKQLALAILARILTNEKVVLEYYESFAKEYIEIMETSEWIIEDKIILNWLNSKNAFMNNPFLPPMFRIVNNFMFLNNKKLGSHLNCSQEYNMDKSEKEIGVYCNFSEIFHLKIKDLPTSIKFDFIDPVDFNDEEARITDNITFAHISRREDMLKMDFWFKINVLDYKDDINPIKLFNNFHLFLENSIQCEVTSNDADGNWLFLEFTYSINSNNDKDLKVIAKEIIANLRDKVEDVFFKTVDSNRFEAIFNLPEEYQSILKPYMLYFEEFLHDLCIETDVNIRKKGADTILSVEPKNKDEALEKIANALKMYISAPIVASGVSLEQKLQMQVALQKLHAECSHMESQLVLKSATLNVNQQQLIVQDKIISETKRILVEAGVNPEIITKNNLVLLESLKEINLDNKNISKSAFLDTFKAKFKLFEVFETNIEFTKKQLEDKNKDGK
ncbi:MAG: Unknown protein [uncultured Sulfurovum sp.]|uniref:Uncharacterized protein n=1 Tax=uncultured Sulfurovum sp. TaxID=269237 RepID=A0A6S6SAE1_9BACT|nr:MAG: Unknown protein [uncultured Sulfurovum sp.]